MSHVCCPQLRVSLFSLGDDLVTYLAESIRGVEDLVTEDDSPVGVDNADDQALHLSNVTILGINDQRHPQVPAAHILSDFKDDDAEAGHIEACEDGCHGGEVTRFAITKCRTSLADQTEDKCKDSRYRCTGLCPAV